ncbi:MAG: EMC3/TMCO1 family protein [archaeon]
MFEKLMDPMLSPLLDLGFFWAIFIVAFILTLIITLVYKFTTDQTLMKKLKSEMKTMQKELKALSSNPQKAMAHQKKIMEKNMKYMKHSLKPTLYTFIPIIIIFGWLNTHLAYLPIAPGNDFMISVDFKDGTYGNVTIESLPELQILSEQMQTIENNQAKWTLSGDAGEYELTILFDNREFKKSLIISSENEYSEPIMVIKDSNLKRISIGYEKVKPLGNVSLLGWRPGWLGTYILLSLIFSLSMRKILKIS